MPNLVGELQIVDKQQSPESTNISQAFVSHFWEFWPKNVKFSRNGRLVEPEDWPEVLEAAHNPSKKVVLDLVFK